MRILYISVNWETDGEDVTLPKIVGIPSMPETEIADYLSDNYGWLVNDFVVIREGE